MARKTAVLIAGLLLFLAVLAAVLLLTLRDNGLMGEGVTFVQKAARFRG